MLPKERMAEGEWVPPWLRYQHLARYEWAVSFCSGKRVLDAACGNGYGAELLRHAGAAVVGLDVAAEGIEEGQHLGRRNLLLGDATILPFRSGAFDIFVSFETVEHVKAHASYVAEAHRVLKRGGTFICSTPNRALVNPGNTIDDRPFNPFHIREYTQRELAAVLQSKFSSIEWFGQTPFPGWYAAALGSVGRRSKSAGVRLHQARKLAGIALESIEKHRPRALPFDGQPEVLIAVCR
jgi:SAM-dependent methyltransferase